MKYVSTRGRAPVLSFEEVLLTGLARDGGLYMPSAWPQLTSQQIAALSGQSYQDTAFAVMQPFVADDIPDEDLKRMIATAYASFGHKAVTPLKQLDSNAWLLELFHGPTLAFKDVAMQMLGQLFDYALKRQGKRVTIIGATSGDTGSSAIEAMRGREAVDIFILHPHNRTSEVQRRQMTTVLDDNVHNIAIDGTFDDCQALVKAMFNDAAFRDEVAMGGVNSINWARVMAQIVYYFTAAVALGSPHRPVSFSVPTGNFGDVLAGYAAARMGLPVEQLVIATNTNDILARTLATGRYEVTSVTPTFSPSMDIQVSSNFERLLFDAYDRDASTIERLMNGLAQSGAFQIEDQPLEFIRSRFASRRTDEADTLQTIKQVYGDTGEVIDPHTAVGIAAARHFETQDCPMVTLATAHPAKFPDAIEQALGHRPALPPALASLMDRPERLEVLANDVAAVQALIRRKTRVSADG